MPIKPERLLGDVIYARELSLRNLQKFSLLLVQRKLLQQIKGIGDRLQGVVYFVSQDGGHSAHGGISFRCAKRLLHLFALSNVARYGRSSNDFPGAVSDRRYG